MDQKVLSVISDVLVQGKYNEQVHSKLTEDQLEEVRKYLYDKLSDHELWWNAFKYLNSQLKVPVLQFNSRTSTWQDSKRYERTEKENSRELEEKRFEEELEKDKERQKIL